MEDIIRKIHKLLRLSDSPNQEEAAAASRKAHALMIQYNLKLSVIHDSESEIIKEEFHTGKRIRYWKKILSSGVADAFFCKLLIVHKGEEKRLVFVGRPGNVVISKNMYFYLVDAVERISQEVNANFRKDYKQGLALGLSNRLEQLKKKTDINQEAGALVQVMDSELEKYGKSQNWGKEKARTLSVNAANFQGLKDSEKISLNHQVSAGRKPEALL